MAENYKTVENSGSSESFSKITPSAKNSTNLGIDPKDAVPAWVEQTRSATEALAKQFTDLERRLNDRVEEYEKSKDSLSKELRDRADRDISRLKNEFITIIGIFVSIFTFISVEIQILSSTENVFIFAGLSLILLGGITHLTYLIRATLLERGFENKLIPLLIIGCFIFALGIVSLSIEDKDLKMKNLPTIEARL